MPWLVIITHSAFRLLLLAVSSPGESYWIRAMGTELGSVGIDAMKEAARAETSRRTRIRASSFSFASYQMLATMRVAAAE